jgi:hypothetical protein
MMVEMGRMGKVGRSRISRLSSKPMTSLSCICVFGSLLIVNIKVPFMTLGVQSLDQLNFRWVLNFVHRLLSRHLVCN